MTKRALMLIAYDVADDRRRAKIFKVVKAFGLDGQKSVHECALSSTEKRELKRRLRAVLDPSQDRLLILRLNPRGSIRALTDRRPACAPTYFYVG